MKTLRLLRSMFLPHAVGLCIGLTLSQFVGCATMPATEKAALGQCSEDAAIGAAPGLLAAAQAAMASPEAGAVAAALDALPAAVKDVDCSLGVLEVQAIAKINAKVDGGLVTASGGDIQMALALVKAHAEYRSRHITELNLHTSK